jgi:hypothetical protein
MLAATRKIYGDQQISVRSIYKNNFLLWNGTIQGLVRPERRLSRLENPRIGRSRLCPF